jgi:chemotaxis protein MotB
MRKDPFSKLQSSLTFDEILEQSAGYPHKNWLMTYLDVFVLTVMLVITLMAVNDLKPQQNPAPTNQPQPAKLERKDTAIISQPEQKAITPWIMPEITLGNDIIPFEFPEMLAAEKLPIPDSVPKPPAIQPEKPEPQPVTPVQQADDENRIQQQLSKTINEFGLNETVHIKVKQGYAQLEIQDKVLFKSSQAALTAEGAAVLKRLTPLLKQAEGLILIEGHTDNLPITTSQFPSNWELGSSRATSVLHFLASQQLDSSRMRATTYADTQPIADNSTPEGREKNRRVNIVIKVADQQL